jgi:hypothetical protein
MRTRWHFYGCIGIGIGIGYLAWGVYYIMFCCIPWTMNVDLRLTMLRNCCTSRTHASEPFVTCTPKPSLRDIYISFSLQKNPTSWTMVLNFKTARKQL